MAGAWWVCWCGRIALPACSAVDDALAGTCRLLRAWRLRVGHGGGGGGEEAKEDGSVLF